MNVSIKKYIHLEGNKIRANKNTNERTKNRQYFFVPELNDERQWNAIKNEKN